MKILLIDDEQALLKVFTETLQALGHFEVETAETGNDGMEKVRSLQPDLVLLDQVLPDINGNQILQMIKQDPSTKNIPVAMLSNFNQDNLVQEAINLGALDYILKYQVEPEDLVAKVNKLIKENVKQPAIENAVPLMPKEEKLAAPVVTAPQPTPVTPAPIIPTPNIVQPTVSTTPITAPTQVTPTPVKEVSSLPPVQQPTPVASTPAQPAIPTPPPSDEPIDLNKLLNIN
ncbi:MAG TPA: response regulator [Patescibacteria group bacterium]